MDSGPLEVGFWTPGGWLLHPAGWILDPWRLDFATVWFEPKWLRTDAWSTLRAVRSTILRTTTEIERLQINTRNRLELPIHCPLVKNCEEVLS